MVERRTVTGVALRWSHLIVALIVYLLSIGVLYGTMRSQIDEQQRISQELKDKKVDQRQFDEMKDEVIRRLDRIENKLDRERALRELR